VDEAAGITAEQDHKMRENLRKDFGSGPYPLMLRYGTVSMAWMYDVHKWKGSTNVDGTYFIMPSGETLDVLSMDSIGKRMAEVDFGRGAITAYEELIRMSALRTFIVEKRPSQIKTKNRYLKASERPVYTVVSPSKARSIMNLPDPEKEFDEKGKEITERRAHMRREHDRDLRSEKFTKKRGKTIHVRRSYIPAVWRGESESASGKHHYRVVLDLPKSLRDSV
jgi:hypothetical protein